MCCFSCAVSWYLIRFFILLFSRFSVSYLPSLPFHLKAHGSLTRPTSGLARTSYLALAAYRFSLSLGDCWEFLTAYRFIIKDRSTDSFPTEESTAFLGTSTQIDARGLGSSLHIVLTLVLLFNPQNKNKKSTEFFRNGNSTTNYALASMAHHFP